MLRYLASIIFVLSICLPWASAAEEKYWEYTFRPGDSIWRIANRYTTSPDNWLEIQQINQVRQGHDRVMKPGTRIVIPVAMLKNKPVPATVLAVSGGASLISPNGEQRQLKVGDKLFTGDKVVTKDKQRILIQFADLSELQVQSLSEVVLDQISYFKESGMADTRIRLNIGSVTTSVKKQTPNSRYQIRTPASVTAVRGTEFRLSSDDSAISRTEVTEGIVNVSAGSADEDVKQKFGIIAEEGKPLPKPVKLLPAPSLKIEINMRDGEMLASWESLDGAASYQYELSSDAKFTELIAGANTKDNKASVASLGLGIYYMRVRGIHENKLQGLNSVSPFEIVKDDSVPTEIYTPTNILLIGI